jgi:hypothetical protein
MPAVKCHRVAFELLCRRRGFPLADAMQCVISRDGDRWEVDVSHPSYPREPFGLGDLVASGLAAVGITPQLVERVTGRKGCGCKQRQRALNEAGFAVQRAAREFYIGE